MFARLPANLFPDGDHKGEKAMLWTIVIILLVLWALGFGFGALGNLVHLILVVALVVVVVQLARGRRI